MSWAAPSRPGCASCRLEALERIGHALDEFEHGEEYGEITIRLQAGKVIWVDQFIREWVG